MKQRKPNWVRLLLAALSAWFILSLFGIGHLEDFDVSPSETSSKLVPNEGWRW